MDAVAFLKELRRMEGDAKITVLKGEEKKLVGIVEKWSKEHPFMTNAMKYKEVFGVEPKRMYDENYICPGNADCSNLSCAICQKWWDEEYISPKTK